MSESAGEEKQQIVLSYKLEGRVGKCNEFDEMSSSKNICSFVKYEKIDLKMCIELY